MANFAALVFEATPSMKSSLGSIMATLRRLIDVLGHFLAGRVGTLLFADFRPFGLIGSDLGSSTPVGAENRSVDIDLMRLSFWRAREFELNFPRKTNKQKSLGRVVRSIARSLVPHL